MCKPSILTLAQQQIQSGLMTDRRQGLADNACYSCAKQIWPRLHLTLAVVIVAAVGSIAKAVKMAVLLRSHDSNQQSAVAKTTNLLTCAVSGIQ